MLRAAVVTSIGGEAGMERPGQRGAGEEAKKDTRGNLAEDLIFVAFNYRDSSHVPSAS
jgi:hypothetical protein